MVGLNILKMRFKLKILLLLSLSLIITGCVPVIVGGGMVAGGYTALRDKSVGDSLSDSKIDLAIKQKLYKIDHNLFSQVSVVTDCGCVLLTGIVTNPDWISAAERETWTVRGVKEVNNHIEVADKEDPGRIVKDDFITSACRSALVCKKEVRSVNYKIKTMNGVVYVLGIARTQAELDIALSTIQKISGVRKVVSYVKVG